MVTIGQELDAKFSDIDSAIENVTIGMQGAVTNAANALMTADSASATANNANTNANAARAQATEAVQQVAGMVDSVSNLSDGLNNVNGALNSAQSNIAILAGQVGDVAERVRVLENAAPGTGSGGGGYGPNYIAAANTPTPIKDAIRRSGGVVCTGANDHLVVQSALNAFGQVVAVQGDYAMSGMTKPPARRSLLGWGTLTNFVGASGLSGAMFMVNTDHVHLQHFAMTGSGDAAGTHHVVVDSTSKSGFWTGSEATIFISHLVSKNAKGDGIQMTSTYNRDSKIEECHIYNPAGNGVYIACPDGMISKVTVGTPGGYGFHFDKAANWEAGFLKAWYCEKDGFLLDTVRCGFNNLQAQDNRMAGIRLLGGTESSIVNSSADSNSWNSGTPTPGVHSGFEIGTLPAGMTNGSWSQGATSGGNDWLISGLRAYDKAEGGRGYNQRYGVLVGNVTGLIVDNVHTGRAGGSHHNLTDGVFFANANTRNSTSNAFSNIRSHGVAA